MLNREVFARDPLSFTLPNDGVAKVGAPESKQEWAALKFELESFVCEGAYQRGLERILRSFLSSLAEPTQPAVWVSGFYGSGKSHLVRVLEYLWNDERFPDGATARGLVELPQDIREQFTELSTAGKRAGGPWSAAGKLSGSAGESIRLALLGIVFQAAGLPDNYAQAKLELWLEHEGVLGEVEAQLEEGRSLKRELQHLYVSTPLADALLRAKPEFAASSADALQLLRAQFPTVHDISEEAFLSTMTEVLKKVSTTPGKLPLTLIVLDELEQYVANDPRKMAQVQAVVEACSSRFGGSLLLVATGQSALQASGQLSKVQGRFTVRVELASSDVETVLRQVVLRKKPSAEPKLKAVLERVSGEIDRQLAGSPIGPRPADKGALLPDYPLLPARHRFWERVLREVDRVGTAGQLRSQLRIALEATRSVAEDPLGAVVGGDFLYGQVHDDMLKTGALSAEVDALIEEQLKLEAGEPRARLAGLVFLIGKLPRGGAEDAGIRATAETLADLLVRDLEQDGAKLRAAVPELLAKMVESGPLMPVDDEYRLQSKASSEWASDFRARLRGIASDSAGLASARQQAFKEAVSRRLGKLKLLQGESKAPRKVELAFGSDAPASEAGEAPLWVRDGWQAGERETRDEARQLGNDSPVVTVFLPLERADALQDTLARFLAAEQVLETRPIPTDPDGIEARGAMKTRQQTLRAELDSQVSTILSHALVFQGGGSEVSAGDLAESVHTAAENALSRLFPEFHSADDRRWEKVFSRAKAGNADALAALGYSGDADKQPVAQAVLAFVGSPKSGAQVRKHFARSPYGWPQDAVDGALAVLICTGHVRAELNGESRGAKQLNKSSLGKMQLRAESTVITVPEKLAIRKLLSEAGVKFQSGDEAGAALELVSKLQKAAQAAGGAPPLPEAPSALRLKELETLRGNDLLKEVFAQKEALLKQLNEWRDIRQRIEEREPRWRLLEQLLEHGQGLPELQEVGEQKASLTAHRGLLNEPNPLRPLLEQTTETLRKHVTGLRQSYQTRFEAEMERLAQHPAWQKLEPATQTELLRENHLEPLPEAKLGGAEEVRQTLDTLSLAQLQDRLDALPGRFAAALQEAQKRTEPKAAYVTPAAATLTSEADLEAYLTNLRDEILAHLKEGHPVILS